MGGRFLARVHGVITHGMMEKAFDVVIFWLLVSC